MQASVFLRCFKDKMTLLPCKSSFQKSTLSECSKNKMFKCVLIILLSIQRQFAGDSHQPVYKVTKP